MAFCVLDLSSHGRYSNSVFAMPSSRFKFCTRRAKVLQVAKHWRLCNIIVSCSKIWTSLLCHSILERVGAGLCFISTITPYSTEKRNESTVLRHSTIDL